MSWQFPDRTIGHKYETVFSIFLIVLAFLYRDNPYLVYPQVLYLLLCLLVLNLGAVFTLRRWPKLEWWSAFIILANCANITALLNFSGGPESNLWVLYLLPIYTACILLAGSHVTLVALGAISFNLAFHAISPAQDFGDALTLFNLGIKTGIILFAAAMTWKIVDKNRMAARKLANEREMIAQLEETLKTQSVSLQTSEKLADIGQISAGVAHDLNNPITVIFGTVKVLLEDIDSYPALKRDFERILRSAELCRDIVGNLLNIAKNQTHATTSCNITDLVDSTVSLYEHNLSERGIRVRRVFAADVPPVAVAKPQFQRVILNLVENAKAAMSGGGLLTVKIERLPSKRSDVSSWIQISIEDTGPGIPEEFMEKLFKPFNTTKPPTEGTGLGLYLSREIVMQHQGRLRAENKPDGGARFVITLPAQQPMEMAA